MGSLDTQNAIFSNIEFRPMHIPHRVLIELNLEAEPQREPVLLQRKHLETCPNGLAHARWTNDEDADVLAV